MKMVDSKYISTMKSPQMLKEELRRQKDDTEVGLRGCKVVDYQIYREAKFRADLLTLAMALLAFLAGVISAWS